MLKARFWRGLKWTILCLVALLVTAVVVLASVVFHKAPAPVVETNPAAAAEFEAKLKQADAAVPGSQRILTADQSELNSFIDSRLQLTRGPAGTSSSSLRDLKLLVKEDRMRIYVLINTHGKDMTMEVEGKVRTENGYLRFDPLSGRIGALPIPRSALRSAMAQMMNSPESREQLRLPDNVSDVHVADGKIMATFK